MSKKKVSPYKSVAQAMIEGRTLDVPAVVLERFRRLDKKELKDCIREVLSEAKKKKSKDKKHWGDAALAKEIEWIKALDLKEFFNPLLSEDVDPVVEANASPQYRQASAAMTNALSNPGDHAAHSGALRTINGLVGQITDPKEREEVGKMIGFLTGQVDATTAGGGRVSIASTSSSTPVAR